MKKPIQISIPTPCNENWDAMTPEAKGRFCSSCEKKVFDFTTLSDKEILNILSKNENTCARITSAQLNRKLIAPKEKSSLWMATSAAVISFITIGNNMVSAQTPVNTEQTDLKTDDIIGKVALPQPEKVSGTVFDENHTVLPGVWIIIEGKSQGILTDTEGHYTITARPDDKLTFSYLGYASASVLVGNHTNINITLEYKSVELQGDVIILKRRTLAGRVLHSIGNLFR